MKGADAGTGQHGSDGDRRHGQIDDDRIAALDTVGLENVGETVGQF